MAPMLLLFAWASQIMTPRTEVAGECALCWPAAFEEPRGRAEEGPEMNLLQARSWRPGTRHGSPTAWVTGPWDDCLEDCGPMRFREVHCFSVYDGGQVPEADCEHQKPASSKACVCGGLEVCRSALGQCPHSDGVKDPTGTGFEHVGCFEFDDQPAQSGPTQQWAEDPVFDPFCMEWEGDTLCRSGLPFYAYSHKHMSREMCWSFCISKGLEISGIVWPTLCRCGATVLNKQAWHMEEPRKGLAFDPHKLKGTSAAACKLKVFRYTGYLESNGVPMKYWQRNVQDTMYRDSIMAGYIVDPSIIEDGKPEEGASQEQGGGERTEPSFNRLCWPDDGIIPCNKWRVPWRTRFTTALPGVDDVWEEYVNMTYAFESGLDTTRKEAFRAAVEIWKDNTCINLVEETQLPFSVTTYMMVGVYSTSSCYFSYSYSGGIYGTISNMKINLGWCNSMSSLGSMIHEIGHALGMNHEQKRPDATITYHGYGPHLKIYWQNIGSSWIPQWTPDYNTYTGSGDDGEGDVHKTGWYEYNYESIMHYGPWGGQYDSIPESKKSSMGQRSTLTVGDIEQITDTYQCHAKVPTPSPTPPTPPPTPPTPPPTPPTPTPPTPPPPTPTPCDSPHTPDATTSLKWILGGIGYFIRILRFL